MPADLPAYFESVETRHQPIQERQPWPIGHGQALQRLTPVLDNNNFITCPLQGFFQKAPCEGLIVGYEDSRSPMFSSQPGPQWHSGLPRLARCPLSISEGVKTGRMSPRCRNLRTDRRASRAPAGSRPDKKYAHTLFDRFANSIAITERILPVVDSNALSPKVQWHQGASRVPACGRTTQVICGTFSSYKLRETTRQPKKRIAEGYKQCLYWRYESQRLLLRRFLFVYASGIRVSRAGPGTMQACHPIQGSLLNALCQLKQYRSESGPTDVTSFSGSPLLSGQPQLMSPISRSSHGIRVDSR